MRRHACGTADIAPSIEWARKEAERTSRPVLVEIMIERTANAAMGTSPDNAAGLEMVVEGA